MRQSFSSNYFEQMFASDPDPWRFATSSYERKKYDRSMDALKGRRYELALEVGCANGLLTSKLAPSCDKLLSIDVSHSALSLARRHNAGFMQVDFAEMQFPIQVPNGLFDLIVLSEVVYYWSESDIIAAGDWISTHIMKGGDALLVHWTGETDYPQSGDQAVKLLRAAVSEVDFIICFRADEYRLDLWRLR